MESWSAGTGPPLAGQPTLFCFDVFFCFYIAAVSLHICNMCMYACVASLQIDKKKRITTDRRADDAPCLLSTALRGAKSGTADVAGTSRV